jgi:hypothetical protein
MERIVKLSTYRSLAALVAAITLTGCGGDTDPSSAVAAANSSNIQRVTNLYLAYQTENGWVGPPDEAKFKEFIRGLPGPTLSRIGIDPAQIDGIFTSERDGQPFKIRYKVVGNMMGSTEPVVFEAEGVGGQRMVGFLNMTQREVDAAEYDSLWAGKGAAAATTRSN